MKAQTALTETQKIIASQLLEGTGKSIFDSGSAYGRHYEKNQKTGIDFESGLKIDRFNITIPIQVYMSTMLDYTDTCEAIESKFKEAEIDLSYTNSKPVADFLTSLGYYLEGDWNNTYNWENDLSQDLQFVIFKEGRKYFAIIETHNGCDIRSGYSSGRIYEIQDFDYFILGQRIEVTDPENPGGNPLDSLYMAEKAGMFWNEETLRYEFPDGSEAEFYTSALGF